jgi:putative endonuclease
MKLTNPVGIAGEKAAVEHLKKQGYVIRETNYWQKWGEIDIVAEKRGVIHFVEVKTVTHHLEARLPSDGDYWQPEDNIHPWKLQRLGRTIETYLLAKKVGDEAEWQLDAISVYLDPEMRLLKIDVLEDIF